MDTLDTIKAYGLQRPSGSINIATLRRHNVALWQNNFTYLWDREFPILVTHLPFLNIVTISRLQCATNGVVFSCPRLRSPPCDVPHCLFSSASSLLPAHALHWLALFPLVLGGRKDSSYRRVGSLSLFLSLALSRSLCQTLST